MSHEDLIQKIAGELTEHMATLDGELEVVQAAALDLAEIPASVEAEIESRAAKIISGVGALRALLEAMGEDGDEGDSDVEDDEDFE